MNRFSFIVGSLLLLWTCSPPNLHVHAQTTVTPSDTPSTNTVTSTTPPTSTAAITTNTITTKKAWASTAPATTPASTATGVVPSFDQQWPFKSVTANYYYLLPLLIANDSGTNFAPSQMAQYNAFFTSLSYQSNVSLTPKGEMGNGILPWAISSGGSQSGLYSVYPPLYSYTPGAAISYVDLPLYPIISTTDASFTDRGFATLAERFNPQVTATTAAAKVAPGRIIFIDSFAPLVATIPADSPFTSWTQFVQLCKANPGMMVTAGERYNYIEYAAVQRIMAVLGISFQYTGGVPISSLFGSSTTFAGNTSLYWTYTSMVLSDSRFIPIAVAYNQPVSALNKSVYPLINGSVPTFTSLGIPIVLGLTHSISASTRLTPASQAMISDMLYEIHSQPSYQQFLLKNGYVPTPMVYNESDNGTGVSVAALNIQQTYVDIYYPTIPPTVVIASLVAVDSATPNAIIALAAIGLVMTFVTAIALHHFRHHPVFVAASIPFCFLILSGIVVGFVALIVLAGTVINSPFASTETTSMCRAFPFLFGVSFNLIFAPLFWKTKRLIDIFYNKDLTSARNLTNMSIIKNIALLLLVETAFQLCWVLIDPLSFKTFDIDNLHYTYTCQCNYFWVWVGIMIGAKAMLLLFGVGLAFKTRNLESQFNESKAIGFCLYNITLCSLLLPIVFIMRQQSVELQYILMCAGFFLCLLICLVAMFAPKIHLSVTLSAEDAHAQFMYKRSSKPAKRFAGESSGGSGANSGGGGLRASSGTAAHHNKRGSTNNEVSRTSNSQQQLQGPGSSSMLQLAHTNQRGSATSVKEMSEMSMLAGMIRHQQVAIQKESIKNGADANGSNMFLLSSGGMVSNMSGGLVSNVSNLSGIIVHNPSASAANNNGAGTGSSNPAISSSSNDSSATVTPLQSFRDLRDLRAVTSGGGGGGDEIRTPSVQLESVLEVQRQVQFGGDGGALTNTSSSAEPQSPFEPSSSSSSSNKTNPSLGQGAKRPSVLSVIAERIKNRSVTSFGETFTADAENEHEQSAAAAGSNQQQRDHGIIQLTFDAEGESASSSGSKNPKKNSHSSNNENDEIKRTSVLSSKHRHAI